MGGKLETRVPQAETQAALDSSALETALALPLRNGKQIRPVWKLARNSSPISWKLRCFELSWDTVVSMGQALPMRKSGQFPDMLSLPVGQPA